MPYVIISIRPDNSVIPTMVCPRFLSPEYSEYTFAQNEAKRIQKEFGFPTKIFDANLIPKDPPETWIWDPKKKMVVVDNNLLLRKIKADVKTQVIGDSDLAVNTKVITLFGNEWDITPSVHEHLLLAFALNGDPNSHFSVSNRLGHVVSLGRDDFIALMRRRMEVRQSLIGARAAVLADIDSRKVEEGKPLRRVVRDIKIIGEKSKKGLEIGFDTIGQKEAQGSKILSGVSSKDGG